MKLLVQRIRCLSLPAAVFLLTACPGRPNPGDAGGSGEAGETPGEEVDTGSDGIITDGHDHMHEEGEGEAGHHEGGECADFDPSFGDCDLWNENVCAEWTAEACNTAPLMYADGTVQDILSSNCVDGCHDAGQGIANLDLSQNLFANLVDQDSSVGGYVLISPGDPVESYLWHKIRGTHACDEVGGGGAAMPNVDEGRCPLPHPVSTLLQKWVCCGACESAGSPCG